MIDLASITTVFSSIKSAKDLAGALVGLRDFNQVAATVTKINSELIQAQESVFAHQAKMLELQASHHDAMEELRKLKDSISQRSRYSLIELSKDVFVYRLKIPEERVDDAVVYRDEPIHHACQRCMDNSGIRSILKRGRLGEKITLDCTVCSTRYQTTERAPTIRIRLP